jgi:hypothetical protein
MEAEARGLLGEKMASETAGLLMPNVPSTGAEHPIATEKLSKTGMMATKVQSEFNNFKRRLRTKHDTWIEIEANYNGRYLSPITEGSNVFMRLTRLMVSLAMAKLLPIVIPATGSPWTVEPSPVPDVDGVDPVEASQLAQMACELMENRIRDNFEEMHFYEQVPQALLDACLYGTMVWRGPLGSTAKKSRWAFTQEKDPETGEIAQGYKKVSSTDSKRPEHKHISIWDVYPDPGAKSIKNCTSVIIRHTLTASQLRDMAESGDFDADEIYALLNDSPIGNFVAEIHESQRYAINREFLDSLANRYVVLERWGYLSGQDLKDAGYPLKDGDIKTQKMFQTWVSGTHVIKNDIADYFTHPPFLFCPYEIIPQTIFGRGVAEQCMDTQAATNSLVRGLIDSMAWAMGPQTEIDAAKIEPGADGYVAKPRKVWVKRRLDIPDDGQPAVRFFNVPFQGDQILAGIKYFQEMFQMQTGVSFSNGGFQQAGNSGVRTDGMQTMQYRNAESFAQLVVKNLDTFFFTPMVREHYDWEMVYNPDIKLKGDYQVTASGIRGAMAREIALQKKIELLQSFSGNPDLVKRINVTNWVNSYMRDLDIDEEGLVYTDEEYKQIQNEEMQRQMALDKNQQENRRFKAETPVKDALVTLASRIPDTNPVFAPAYAEAYKALGADSPQIYVALSAISEKQAHEYETAGIISAQDAQTLATDYEAPASGGKSAMPDSAGESAPQGMPQGMMPQQGEGEPEGDEGLPPEIIAMLQGQGGQA